MEAVGLALAVVSSFKEVYIVSRFIYRTLSSVKHNKAQKQAIEREFRSHILFLQSLGLLFFSSNGITQNQQLDELWLEQILAVFEDVRISCSDYARIASKKDKDYMEYSPELHRDYAFSGAIEFDLHQPLVATSSASSSLFSLSLDWFRARTRVDIAEPLHWAFMEKRRLERVLRHFESLRDRLQEILPLYIAFRSSQQGTTRQVLERVSTDENAERLGIASHARLQLLQADEEFNGANSCPSKTFDLHDYLLDAPLQTNSLGLGLLKKKRAWSDHGDKVLVEYKGYIPYNRSETTIKEDEYFKKLEQKINRLSDLLSSAGADELHTLPFKGYIHQPESNRHAFIFQYPDATAAAKPVSLHTMIEAEGSLKDIFRISLDDRYASAQKIAQSIGIFHNDGWVHKSIRSESIVFFQRPGSSQTELVIEPYLVNFEYIRPECDGTLLDYDLDFEKDLYRHPERQGIPSKPFNKMYDLYALGVVLLEVGMWQTARDIYKSASWEKTKGTRPSPRGIQRMFLDLAKRKLAHKMGRAYQEVVVACLEGTYKEASLKPGFSMIFYKNVVEKLGGR